MSTVDLVFPSTHSCKSYKTGTHGYLPHFKKRVQIPILSLDWGILISLRINKQKTMPLVRIGNHEFGERTPLLGFGGTEAERERVKAYGRRVVALLVVAYTVSKHVTLYKHLWKLTIMPFPLSRATTSVAQTYRSPSQY